jgi:hypothetical protein
VGHTQRLITSHTKANGKVRSFITSEEPIDEGSHQTREEINSKNQITKENDSFLN